MNILYRKVAVTSACTVLSFVLGASPEAKAASFTFKAISSFALNTETGGGYLVIFPSGGVLKGTTGEIATSMEFNIGSLSMDTNTVITSAVLEVKLGFPFPGLGASILDKPSNLGIFGYIGDGIVAGIGGGTVSSEDVVAGVFLSSVNISSLSTGDTFNFNVTEFLNQRVSNGDTFAGLTIRALELGGFGTLYTNESNPNEFSLIVETADVTEPVPEPTTIFGSAIALGVVGGLKRKKLSQRNKTML